MQIKQDGMNVRPPARVLRGEEGWRGQCIAGCLHFKMKERMYSVVKVEGGFDSFLTVSKRQFGC